MGDGDVTQVGPYTLPLGGVATAAIKALRNSANDKWLITQDAGTVFVINIEES